MSEVASRLLSLEEEIEGDRHGTVEFFFSRIGEPVPLKPTGSSSVFDLSNSPLQPLAVSEFHHLLFLAHSEGFFVANTKDVIGLAKDIKDQGKGPCVQKSCIVDVQIGRVSILALSGDSSMLAATVGGYIHLFHVQSLLNKVHEPAISAPLNNSGIVKDLKWRRSSENSFIVLSSHGSLCHGSSDLQLKGVIDNVDSVDWSVDGNLVAIAKKGTVSILSSNFEELHCMQLLFQSWTVDSGSEIQVDSIKWVRRDSIVIGCTRLKEGSEDDGYLVQVITSGEHDFTEASCKPLVFTFPDLFGVLSVDMLPTGVGPYLLLNYLDCWNVAITSNKKIDDMHISLLRWLVEDNRYEVVFVELLSDKYIPKIDLQDNGDSNLILGLAVDKISLYEKIVVQHNLEFIELTPRCILFCLTCDGKLALYHTAWVSEPSDLPKLAFSHDDNIVNFGLGTLNSSESNLGVNTQKLKVDQHAAIATRAHSSPDKLDVGAGDKMGSHGILDGVESYSHPAPGMITSSYSSGSGIEEPYTFNKAGDLGTNSNIYEMASESSVVKRSGTGYTSRSNTTLGSSFNPQIAQKPLGVNGSNTSASSTEKETVTSNNLGSIINERFSSPSQTSKPIAMDDSKTKFLLSSSGESNLAGMVNEAPFLPPLNSLVDLPNFSQPYGNLTSSEKISQSGLSATTKSGHTRSSSILNSSPVAISDKLTGSRQQILHANNTFSKPRQILESGPKQFYNVKDVTKELDALLSSIECKGGFKDLCTVVQEQSLMELEAGSDNLSKMLFVYRNKIKNQLMEIQLLRNKMLEVSARQVYMECIVQQASDNRYWEIWNTQKLSPEFEAKRLHILNLKQNLTNQLVELERHFNSLEINRFGDHEALLSGGRAPRHISVASRPTQSLHSVYTTVNSQLAAAEQLSECLSKQMAVLNITSPTLENRNFAKELFESIGLDPKADTFMFPELNSSKLAQYSSKRSSPSSSTSLKEHSWKFSPTFLKAFESTRRNRDSLDKRWWHFEPSRITIKRTSNKEQVRSNLDITFRDAKENFDSQVKAFGIDQTSKSNFSRASSNSFGITKGTSTGAALSMSKASSSYSQTLEHSPSKGVQENYCKQTIDDHPKYVFNWAKSPSDFCSETFQSATTQSSSFTTPSLYSNSNSNKADKSGFPPMFNMVTSSAVNQSRSAATKTDLVSKPTHVSTHQKLSDSVSPMKTESAAEKRSQLNQESGLKNEVDVLSKTQASTKNLAVPSSTVSPSIVKSANFLPSSSLPSLQFGKSSPSKSNTPSSFSNELAFKSVPFHASVHASEASRSSNEIGSELELATSESTNNSALPKERSELKTDTSQFSGSKILPPKKEFGLHLSSTIGAETDNTNDSKLRQMSLQTPSISIMPSTVPSATNEGVFSVVSDFQQNAESVRAMSSSIMTAEKDEPLDDNLSQEDEMEEEALDTDSVLNLESLGGFSLQSTTSFNALKTNPFGSSFVPAATASASPTLSWNASTGQLFRPPSFNLPESQPSQSTFSNSSTGVVSGGFSGFGQPAQLGAGQQVLGSVLGSFGQSRQLGTALPGLGFASSGIPAAGSSGGLASGGFAGAATGSGFAGVAPNAGGFAGASTFGGGFAGAASAGGGFARVTSAGGGFAGAAFTGSGFAGAASSGGGFAGAASASVGFGGANPVGGFGGFSNIQGGGFSGFGAGNSSAGRPPAELLMQMRK